MLIIFSILYLAIPFCKSTTSPTSSMTICLEPVSNSTNSAWVGLNSASESKMESPQVAPHCPLILFERTRINVDGKYYESADDCFESDDCSAVITGC
jgi:hypothetical protein